MRSAYFSWTLLLLAFLFIETAHAEDSNNLLFFQPEVGYQAPRIFTSGETAEYRGLSYGGSVYYKFGDDDFSFAPFVGYLIGGFNSTANTATRTEKVTEKTLSAGIKFYFSNLFLRASYHFVSLNNRALGGASNIDISDSGRGFGGGIGVVINLSNYVKLEVSGDVENIDFKTNPIGFTRQSQYLRFGGTVGLGILLPSSPPRRNYFKSKLSSPIDMSE